MATHKSLPRHTQPNISSRIVFTISQPFHSQIYLDKTITTPTMNSLSSTALFLSLMVSSTNAWHTYLYWGTYTTQDTIPTVGELLASPQEARHWEQVRTMDWTFTKPAPLSVGTSASATPDALATNNAAGNSKNSDKKNKSKNEKKEQNQRPVGG